MTSGRGPRVGERFTNPSLANVLESLVSDGADGFYRGWIAERIVSEVAHEGGVMTHSDLASHAGEWVDPISALYGGYRIWECPPNGQGLAALLALQCYDRIKARASGPVARAHAQIEAMRQAFADAARHVADPAVAPAPLAELLSDEYAERRASDIDLSRRLDSIGAGLSPGRAGDDTVYFSVVDEAGNGCSFINSNYMGFGTGIVPEGCGFSLQNRGRGFVLEEGHPNVLSGGKRPYHTIIPALITTESDELAAVFGVMGGMMQPQGHLQVASHLIDNQMDPQSALDAARWQIADGAPNGKILIENDADPELIAGLRGLGHPVEMVAGVQRGAFGLGQIIAVGTDRMLWSGSDPRGDGHAAGF
jgi:gamma-glutamyltranspeptidase/glutathione hydrolase